ncbi:clusterin-like protein 1 isoform X2 [Poeciliopsis prolifica]|nr:clusterin-like protein 1 isoform X2 [Poeciliopsis prolifica]
MEKEQEKHRHLMEEVRHSGDKKRGAMQLARETEQKLEEAERQCRDLTKSFFGECRPCLEDSCKAFFTSTCRRGYASFVFEVEEFFRKMASQVDATELNSDKLQSGSAESQIKKDETDMELLQADAAFTQLLSNISDLYNQSISLMKNLQHVLGPSLLEALTSELQSGSISALPNESDSLLKSWGLDRIFYSAFAFGKDVLEELSSTVEDVFEEIQEADKYFHHSNRDAESLSSFGQHPNGYLCRTLRRQASQCWQLQNLCETCGKNLIKECPRLQQLHSEMEEMHTLLNASRLQYDDRLQLVHRHTADTQRWLGDTRDKYGWISWAANDSGAQSSSFRVIAVNLQQQLRTKSHGADISVVVSILDSAPLTVSAPADLMVEDPAFMEYIADHALTLYKQQISGMN